MLRIRLGRLALVGLAALAGALAPVVARAEQPALQIVVLLREHAGRDADLGARPVTDAELEALARAAAAPLERSRVEAGGAQVLSLPARATDAERAAILRSLRALPQVLWAEELSAVEAEAGPSRPFADIDRLIVKLADRRSRDDSDAGRPMPQETVRELSRRAGVSLYYERPVSGGAYALRLFQRLPPESVAAIAARLEADPAVAYAEPSVRGRFGAVPDDPLFPQQWPLFTPGGGIRAPAAWERTTGDPSIVVAVVDSGILPDHPDLRGRLLPGWDFVSDVRRSNDLDGRDADPTDPGDATLTSECASGSPPSPSTWHGTHVAGTIGAASDNGLGVAGVDWQARILPARVGAKCGIDPIDLVDAIRWVADAGSPTARIPETSRNANPARVINLSMEFPGRCPRSLQDSITDAIAAGALIVAAAGNAAAPAETFHPGNCRGVVTVHATDRDGARAPYSNYGKVDLSAPGGATAPDPEGGVLSTSFAGERGAGFFDYGFKVGTSMAAPIVSGVAALVLSVRPTLRPGELRDLLVETARPFPTGTTSDCVADGPLSCGSGIVDAAAAVAAAARAVSSSRGARSTSGDGG
jgi:serine protease